MGTSKPLDITLIKGYIKDKEIIGHIYVIENILNNKKYIGYSCNQINSRQERNYYGGGIEINNALKKYGKDNFVKRIIHIFYELELMLKYEYVYKFIYKSFTPNGYNVLKIIEGISPMKDPLIAKKVSIKGKGRPSCKKGIKLIGDKYKVGGWKNKGKKHSKETIQLLCQLQSGERNGFYGKKHTPEAIERMKLRLFFHRLRNNYKRTMEIFNRNILCEKLKEISI